MKISNLLSLSIAFLSFTILSYGQITSVTADEVGPSGDADVLQLGENVVTINGDLQLSSDARLKSNIVSLGATLSKLMSIDGKSYTFKNSGEKRVGVLAQDIQEQFPDLVKERQDGMLTVNYQGLIPVLINALKEQNIELNLLYKKNDDLERRLQKLESLLTEID